MKEFENDHIYRTGSTNPPKSYRGIIAVLLILVIVLVSIVSVLGMMNIRLFRLLEEQQTAGAVAFSDNGAAEAAVSAPSEGVYIPGLGLTGAEIESVYRSYNQWPQGLYITAVTPNSPAANADLRPGDILVAVDGSTVTGETDFQARFAALQPGDALTLTVFREDEGQTGELTVSLTATKP